MWLLQQHFPALAIDVNPYTEMPFVGPEFYGRLGDPFPSLES